MSKENNPERIDSILNRIIKSLDLDSLIKKEMISQRWNAVVGELMAKHTRPSSFQKGILFVETDSPVWSNEFNLQKSVIREKINQMIGEESIKKIYLRVRR